MVKVQAGRSSRNPLMWHLSAHSLLSPLMGSILIVPVKVLRAAAVPLGAGASEEEYNVGRYTDYFMV